MTWNILCRSFVLALVVCASALFGTDLPPSITSLTAQPVAVSGKTSKLTVVATDDGGSANLTYAWTASGPSPVTFSATGTTAARISTVTFAAPGVYVCTTTVSDALNQTATATVTVTVTATLTTLTISPKTTAVNPSATKTFIATAKDQFGTVMPAAPLIWAATLGDISSAGDFTAGLTPGAATVTVTSGVKSATATIRVNAAPTVAVAAATPSPTISGTQAVFTVQGADDASIDLLKYTWSATGPTGAGVAFAPRSSVNGEQSLATFSAIGDYVVTVAIADKEGLTALSSIPISVLPTPTTLTMAPSTNVVVNPGATKQFTATVRDQFNDALITPPIVTWAVTSGSGLVDTTGLYTAAAPAGPTVVTASAVGGTVSNAVTLRVNAAPTVAQAVQSDGSIPRINTALPLTVLGADDAGEANLTYAWSVVSGGASGVTFVPTGTNAAKSTVVTVTRVGAYTLQARIRDAQGLSVLSTIVVTFRVPAVTPVITWATPAAVSYGTPVSAVQLQATTTVPGTFVYSPVSGTVLSAGSNVLTATFTPMDLGTYTTAIANVALLVQPLTPVLTWPVPAPLSWGTPLSNLQLAASTAVSGIIVYSPAAGTVLDVGAQPLLATFTPTDAVNYTAASATVTVTVLKAATSLTWTAPAPITWGTPLSATELSAVASVPGTLTYVPVLGSTLDVGMQTLTVQFVPTDAVHYLGASAQVPLVVQPVVPTLSWNAPANMQWGTPLSATQLQVTTSQPGSVSFTPSIGTVLEVGAHALAATFTPSDVLHVATATATVTVVVERAVPGVSWPTPASISSDVALSAAQLNALASVPGVFTYTPGLGSTLMEGTHVLQASFTPTDSLHYTTVVASVTLAVTPAAPPATGYVTTYVYDAANRLKERRYDNAPPDTFTYDANGRLTTATSGRYQNSVGRGYDAASRVTRESLTLSGHELVVASAYDQANRLTSQTYPDGSVVSRGYTNRNQLAQVWDAGRTIAARQYDAGGRLLQTQFGNGLTEQRTYLQGDAVVATITIPGVTDFTYTYDANRRKVDEKDGISPNQSQHFSYDPADRVTGWKRQASPLATPEATQQWTLSPVGDWTTTSLTTGGMSTTQQRTHSPVHEVTAINGTPLLYDLKGNLTRDDQGQVYTWDGENRLLTATNLQQGHGNSATYAYDALGRRVKKVVTTIQPPAADGTAVPPVSEPTYFISSGAQELIEITGDLSAFNDPAADPEVAGAAPFDPETGTGARGSLLADPDALRFNFQPASTSTPDGWSADTGLSLQTNQTGWSATLSGTDRDHLGRPLYDSFIPLATATWQVSVANGTHAVVIMCGDADSRAQTNHLTVNGLALVDPTPYDGQVTNGYETGSFDGYAITVNVTNGLLTIGGGSGALNPKINFVEIGAAGSSVDQATTDRVTAAAVQATKDTAKPKAKTPPMVRRNMWLSYVDDLAAYTIKKPRKAAVRYFVASNHLYSVAATTDRSGAVVEKYSYNAHGLRTILTPASVAIAKSVVGQDRGITGYELDRETSMYYARVRMYSATLGRFVGKDPKGYVDGFSMYEAYFVPLGTDPTGEGVENLGEEVLSDNDWEKFLDGYGIHYGDGHNVQGATSWDWKLSVTSRPDPANPCCCKIVVSPFVLKIFSKRPIWHRKSAAFNQAVAAHEAGHRALLEIVFQKVYDAISKSKTCCDSYTAAGIDTGIAHRVTASSCLKKETEVIAKIESEVQKAFDWQDKLLHDKLEEFSAKTPGSVNFTAAKISAVANMAKANAREYTAKDYTCP